MQSKELLARELDYLKRVLALINSGRQSEAKRCLETEIRVVELQLQAEQK